MVSVYVLSNRTRGDLELVSTIGRKTMDLNRLHDHPARVKGFNMAFDMEIMDYFRSLHEAAMDSETLNGGEADLETASKMRDLVDEAIRLYEEGNIEQAICKSEQVLYWVHERANIQHGPDYFRRLQHEDPEAL